MSIGLLFWILMIIGAVLSIWSNYPYTGGYRPFAGQFFIFVLLFLLGWRAFGFIVVG